MHSYVKHKSIDKNVHPNGLSISSSLITEPFAVLFWALSIVLAHILKPLTQPAGLASINNSTGIGTVQQGSVRFNLREEASAPSLYPFSCIMYLRDLCIKVTTRVRRLEE